MTKKTFHLEDKFESDSDDQQAAKLRGLLHYLETDDGDPEDAIVFLFHRSTNRIAVAYAKSQTVEFFDGNAKGKIFSITEPSGSGAYLFQAQDYPGIFEEEGFGEYSGSECFPESWEYNFDNGLGSGSPYTSLVLYTPAGTTVDFIGNIYDEENGL